MTTVALVSSHPEMVAAVRDLVPDVVVHGHGSSWLEPLSGDVVLVDAQEAGQCPWRSTRPRSTVLLVGAGMASSSAAVLEGLADAIGAYWVLDVRAVDAGPFLGSLRFPPVGVDCG